MEINNKVIMVTGGTGSFGNTVIDVLVKKNIKEIRIFSRDEKKQDDMRLRYQNEKLKFYLGDVRDFDSLDKAMNGVDFIFHSAALKQVPSCEFFPLEATKTNVFGTNNVIKAALVNKVKKVVCLSTDKAAYPINAMGISKALMERVAIAEARNFGADDTIVCVTRYGNVIGSRGSVIPLFIKQILENKELTITDPNMTRFLMTLYEAVELVIFAFENGKQGDLFIQKSPSSTIGDLADALLEIFEADNKKVIIGHRHGEKLYETLLTKEEYAKAEDLGSYFRVPADNRNLNYAMYLEQGDEKQRGNEEYNSNNTKILKKNEIIEKLKTVDYLPELKNLLLEK